MNGQFKEYSKMVGFLRGVLPEIYDVLLFEFVEGKFILTEHSDWSSGNTGLIQKRVNSLLKAHSKEDHFPDREETTEVNGNRLMKLFILYIKEEDQLTGALAICLDCDTVIKVNMLMSDILGRDLGSGPEKADPENLTEVIASVMKEYGDDPAELRPTDRVEIIADLYDMDVFRIKGAVAEVANALGISDKSAYRYISKIKKARH
jgi:predicted transcriptional regulator YheO